MDMNDEILAFLKTIQIFALVNFKKKISVFQDISVSVFIY